MRYIILVFILTFSFAQAQKSGFNLTSEGFQDYVVIDVPGKNEGQLYKMSKTLLLSDLKLSEKSVITDLENEIYSLKLGSVQRMGNSFMKGFDTTLRYDLVLRFKDNKVRVDIANLFVVCGTNVDGPNQVSTVMSGLYKIKNGEIIPRNKNAISVIEDLESYFNGVAHLLEAGFNDVELNRW